MKLISAICIGFLIASQSAFNPTNAQSFHKRLEFRSDCSSNNKVLQSSEEYDTNGRLIKTSRIDRNRSTEYLYDTNNNIIAKIHRDSSGRINRFNRISYTNNKLNADTLFNADSTINMIFSSRFSSTKPEQKIFWIEPSKNTYIATQTIKFDSTGNELENKNCSSNADCTIAVYEYNGNQRTSMKVFLQDEMARRRILVKKEVYEYDIKGRLTKATLHNEELNQCTAILTYQYE